MQRAESGKRRQIKREIFGVNFENIIHKRLLFKQPICTSLKILIFFSMSIVTVQHIHTSSLRESYYASFSATIYKEERLSHYILLPKDSKPLTQNIFTFSLSCASLTVFPSFFFLQLWPSFLKYLSTFRSNKKSEPPNAKEEIR